MGTNKEDQVKDANYTMLSIKDNKDYITLVM